MQTPPQQTIAGLPTGRVPVMTDAVVAHDRKPLAALAVLATSALLPLPVHGLIAGLPSVCVFHLLTRRPCPACGLTRSFVCFAHGHVAESFSYHPLGPILFIALALYAAGPILRNMGLTVPRAKHMPLTIAYVALAMLVGVWGLRLAGIITVPVNL